MVLPSSLLTGHPPPYPLPPDLGNFLLLPSSQALSGLGCHIFPCSYKSRNPVIKQPWVSGWVGTSGFTAAAGERKASFSLPPLPLFLSVSHQPSPSGRLPVTASQLGSTGFPWELRQLSSTLPTLLEGLWAQGPLSEAAQGQQLPG